MRRTRPSRRWTPRWRHEHQHLQTSAAGGRTDSGCLRARAQKLDLASLSIAALIEAFDAALQAALADPAGVRLEHRTLAHAAGVAALTGALACLPSAVLAALGAPIPPRTYFASWALNWLGMAAVGGAIMNIFRALGPARGAGAHSLFFLLNFVASPAVAPPELVYPPFRVGLALPYQK